VEAALRAALKGGLSEAEFWKLTPYRLGMILTERGRAEATGALWTGWMVARLAVEREPTLSGPQHYFRQFFDPQATEADAEAMADAEFARIARVYGVDIVDLSEGRETP
jgi:hypothetical protein